jgi:glycosyltransferase involved in cell wall biosynthesis
MSRGADRSAPGAAGGTTWVIPCYNEGERLDDAGFLSLVGETDDIHLLFVNDGSADDTEGRLRALVARKPDRMSLLSLSRNQGKAEAVRQGLLRALEGSADIVGYADADLATPVDELRRLVEVLRGSPVTVLMASRVALLGRQIDRRAVRHYLGRVFATAASCALSLRVYDTQCGAKLFRRTPALDAALRVPFLSRWVFDVELLGRLVTGGDGVKALDVSQIIEEPLRRWRDVPGSKVRPVHALRAAVDLARIAVDLRRRRRSG